MAYIETIIKGKFFVKYGLPEKLSLYLSHIFLFFIVIAVCWLFNWLVKKTVLRLVARIVKNTKNSWDDIFLEKKVFQYMSHIVPAFILFFSSTLFIGHEKFIQRIAETYFIIVFFVVLSASVDAIELVYAEFPVSQEKPIRSYIQIFKIFLVVIGSIIVIGQVINQSPWKLLSGLGALTAIILLVFKDSILGFVAGIQIVTNQLVKLGDWIEMPSHNADGDVIEITLNTVKVQNWDKTITSIPVYSLISESFKNWKGMKDSGGRRIKRHINLDLNSIKLISEDELSRFKEMELLKTFFEEREKFIENMENPALYRAGISNAELFRAYALSYLQNHPDINKGMTLIVRHKQAGEFGLPLELYAFCKDKVWANYEKIQSDIFDYMYSTLPEFDLRAYQAPSGAELQFLYRHWPKK